VKLTAFDFETCDQPAATSIVELGVCVIDNGRIIEQRSWRLAPIETRSFNRHACKTHNITEEDVAGLPTFDDLWPQFRPYFDCDGIIAHNLTFDYGILKERVAALGDGLPCDVGYCTQQMAKSLLIDVGDAGLPNTCKGLGVKYSPSFHHRAINDARMSGECFLQLLSIAQSDGAGISDFAKRFSDLDAAAAERAAERGRWPYDGSSAMSGASVTVSLDDLGWNHSEDFAKQQLDVEDEVEDIAILAAQVKAIASRPGPPQVWSEWAFSITGDECGMDRAALAHVLQQFGAKCDPVNQAFAKTGRAAHGPTNALVFSIGGELDRLRNKDPNSKFKSVVADVQKNGADGSVAILSAGRLFELTITAAEESTTVSRERYCEETLVKSAVRPVLCELAANLPPKKQRGRPRSETADGTPAD